LAIVVLISLTSKATEYVPALVQEIDNNFIIAVLSFGALATFFL